MREVFPVMLFVVVVAAGCGGGSAETEEEVAQIVSEPSVEAVQEEVVELLDLVEVDADGTEFDPPVQSDQIPDGVWYCDMGTVHYARRDQGDGKCPRCGMNLVPKAADPAT